MAKDFRFSEQLSDVLWRETLWYNALRATGAGIIWGALMLFTDPRSSAGMVLAMPVMYFLFLLPIGLVAGWLSSLSVPFVGLISGLCALIIVLGDPLVYTLSRFKPEWVPIQRPNIFSLRIIVFVTSPFAE